MNESYVIPLFLGTTMLAVLMLLFVMGVLFVQKNKQNSYKRRILEARVQEQEKTVNEISKNLHDDVAQLLSHVQMNLNFVGGLGIMEIKGYVQTASDFLLEAMIDVRHISHSLSSEWLKSRGLVGAITEDIEHINAINQVRCQVVVEGEEYDMKHDIELPIFRITQEVIHNMFKHSKATAFTIQMKYQPDLFTIIFSDNGKGFSTQTTNPDSGIGLVNMHERAKLIGGSLQIISGLNKGCQTMFRLPVDEDARMPVFED